VATNNKRLVLALFADEAAARAAAESLTRWDEANQDVRAGAVGIITRDEKGKVKQDLVGGRSTVKGTKIGVILGLILAVPTGGLGLIGGALGGALGGGLVGSLFHHGLEMSAEERARIVAEIEGGRAALGVLTSDVEAPLFASKLQELGGRAQMHEVSATAEQAAAAPEAPAQDAPAQDA
jgi:uncharacterized membrane protein